MNEIAKVKKEVKLKQWAEMVQLRNESGLTVSKWCDQNGVNVKTYYYRLKQIRQALCNEGEQHDIVPVRPVCDCHKDTHIRLSMGNATIELPDDFNEDTLKRLLGVLR